MANNETDAVGPFFHAAQMAPLAPPLPAPSVTAGGILAQAREIVEGSRQQTHGDKERSFDAIAKAWSLYMNSKYWHRGGDVGISGTDVAVMMVLLKVVRSAAGQAETDHFVDMASYAALAGELAAKR